MIALLAEAGLLADVDASNAATAAVVPYLITAIGALVAALGVLFWLFVSSKDAATTSKNEVIAIQKELLPVVNNLLPAVEAIERLTARLEHILEMHGIKTKDDQ